MFNVSELKAGDTVAFCGSYDHEYGFSTVEKVTPSGIVRLANGKSFNKDGHQINIGNHRGLRLMSYADYTRIMTNKAEQRDRNKRMHDLATKVETLLRGKRNGYGDYCSDLSAEEAAEITKLVEYCTKK